MNKRNTRWTLILVWGPLLAAGAIIIVLTLVRLYLEAKHRERNPPQPAIQGAPSPQ